MPAIQKLAADLDGEERTQRRAPTWRRALEHPRRDTDPDGRVIVLDKEGWEHILHEHRELAPHRDEIMATVSSPDHRRIDPRPGRERYYSRELGPSRWLFVVVHFSEASARIVTAYANRKDPPGLTTQ